MSLSRKTLWFEFEVHKRGGSREKVSIPADDYKDALKKMQRIHPESRVSLIRKWTKEEDIPVTETIRKKVQPKAQAENKPPPEEPKAEPAAPEIDKKPYWEVLGVAEDAPLLEVRKAYMKKVKEYHPDRVAGLGEELVALAEKKTFEILEAFNEAQKKLK